MGIKLDISGRNSEESRDVTSDEFLTELPYGSISEDNDILILS
jgi:hypothetical protein